MEKECKHFAFIVKHGKNIAYYCCFLNEYVIPKYDCGKDNCVYYELDKMKGEHDDD